MNESLKDKKSFYKAVMFLVIPIALQNLINVGVNATDVIMLGKVGEKVLSGASLAGQVQFIMMLIFFGLTSGASVLNAQYWGKGDVFTIEKVLGVSIKFTLLVSSLFLVFTYLFPTPIMQLLSNDRVVIEEGAKYLRIVCWSYVFSSLTMVYLNTLRSIEHVFISTIVYSISFIVNLILNPIFIFGLLGNPAMGIKGSATATLISRILEFLIVLYYDRKKNKIFRFRIKLLFIKDKLLMMDFLKYSMPVVLNELLWGSGVAIIAAILGHLGSAASASNSVAQVFRQMATVVSFGVASAAAIMIGKVLGEGKIEVAREYGKRFLNISVLAGIAGTLLILLARPIVLANLSISGEVNNYLSLMMFVMSYFVIGQAINTTLIVGVFRAGGDIKFGMIIDLAVMWIVSIGLGAIAAFVLKLSVQMVYIILLSDEIIKIPLAIWRYKSYKWLNNITR